MLAVSVQITRYVDDHFPGFVECVLVDVLRATHTFVEKVPVVSTESLSEASTYPCNGEIECEICREWQDAEGHAFSTVRIESRWGVESSSSERDITVSSSQLRHTKPRAFATLAGVYCPAGGRLK
jgi:hypothetical protein